MNFKTDFPFFNLNLQTVYLDNASGTQKPEQVISAISDFYKTCSASIYRGIYKFAEKATQDYEDVRELCAKFIGAESAEIVFTRGSTDGINIIADSWALDNLNPGDEILVTEIEHNSNLAPWQRIAKQKGVILRYIPLNFDGTLNLKNIDELLNSKTKLVAISGFSNVLGHIDLIAQKPDFLKFITLRAQELGARVLVDAAQLVPHFKIDVKGLGCDFLVFSGNKMLGPQETGVLYVKSDVQKELEPYQLGGGGLVDINNLSYELRKFPHLFEVGSRSVANIIGLGQALKYLNNIDFGWLCKHEESLCESVLNGLLKSSRVKLLTVPENLIKYGHNISFLIDGMHSHDVADYFDRNNFCVRAGTHCAHLLHKKLGVSDSVRVSFYFYNTHDEIEKFLDVLQSLLKF